MKIHVFTLILLSLQLLAGCKETTVVNELPDTGLIITSIDPEMGGPGMSKLKVPALAELPKKT